ncbi:MAG: hypothetical protein HY699_09940 [Deltaproteobacteria bacterium]|nr:hypothetical protein [Deltaproteobacteria bacterium]
MEDQQLSPAVIIPDNLTALGLVRSLAARGVPCTVAATSALGPAQYSRYSRAVACPPAEAGRAFVEGLSAIGRGLATRPVLFVADESTLMAVARHRQELAAYYRLTIPAAAQLAGLQSKLRLYELAAAAGVPTPETWEINGDEVPAGLPYPLVLKPEHRVIWTGNSCLRSFREEFGAKALLVRDATAAQQVVTRAHALGFALLLQRPIAGAVTDLVTAGVFAGHDGTRALFTARKLAQVPHDFGDGSVVEGVPLPAVEALTWRLVDHAGFVGLADIEFKHDAADGQLRLLDFNPRPWLWIELAARCGVNLPYLLYCETIGRNGQPVPSQSPACVKWGSLRALLRTLHQAGAGQRLQALRTWRGATMGGAFARGDVLWRMLVQPRFWRAALQAARRPAAEL